MRVPHEVERSQFAHCLMQQEVAFYETNAPSWVSPVANHLFYNICVFIPRQLNLPSAHLGCWLLTTFLLIPSHGLTGALSAAFTNTALDVVRSGSFLWRRRHSEAVHGGRRRLKRWGWHPCFCGMHVHTCSRVWSSCAYLGTRCLQWLQREVRKRFKQKTINKNLIWSARYVYQLISSWFTTFSKHIFNPEDTSPDSWDATLWPRNINWFALVCDGTDF